MQAFLEHVAAGVDLVTIKDTMGHRALSTTGRYLHARPDSEQAPLRARSRETGPLSKSLWPEG